MESAVDLLTTKELQDLLKVDRTTIYRMLKDGRITGIRVGNQWRFSRDEISTMLSGSAASKDQFDSLPTDVLPLHCVQPIQQVFAEIAQVGSLTTSPDGEPLTGISNSCRFCDLVLASDSGRKGCIASWRKLAQQSERKPQFATCHAGLQYARARIEVDRKLVAMVIAGQFYVAPPDHSEAEERVQRLAESYNIDANALAEAAEDIRVLDDRHEEQIGGWLQKVADTFEQVARERAGLMNRLRSIASMSTLPNQ
jgi:excisionase family DNA binding protein